jgi:sterol desaturase/sphingolipid hydroxylase (fatty acid hydroxylase superfamily)
MALPLPIAALSLLAVKIKLLKLAATTVSMASLTALGGMAIVFLVEIVVLGYRRSSVYRLLHPTATTRGDLFFFAGRITGYLGLVITLTSLGTSSLGPRLAERWLGWHVLVRIENPVLHALAFIVIYDFVSYWVHRGRHQLGWWWELHRYHHSAEEFNAITTARGHPLDFAAIGIASAVPGAIFGGSIEQFVILGVVLGVHAGLTHSMLDWSWGWFGTYVLYSPVGHRIHHSPLPEHFNKNYGAILPIWDHLFGTYYDGPLVNPAVGMEENPYNRAGLVSDLWLGTRLALRAALRSMQRKPATLPAASPAPAVPELPAERAA